MPRISRVRAIEQPDISEALEWFVGDATSMSGVVQSDDADATPVDLTGVTLQFAVEFYRCTVVERSVRTANLVVSNFVRDMGRPTKVITAVVDPDQANNPGEFLLELPADLLPGDPPAADITTDVPVGLCYLRRSDSAEVRTVRFLIVFRRGYPS